LKGKRYSEEQIIGILREIESGTSVADVCRKHNVSAWSISRWRRKYADHDVPEAKKLKSLEAENARLKRIVANQSLDMEILKETASKNGRTFRQTGLGSSHSSLWPCKPASDMCCAWRIQPKTKESDVELTERIKKLAKKHGRYGYRRIAVMLRREGTLVNTKRIHRIWKLERLQIPCRRPKRRRYGPKEEVVNKAQYPNHVWSYDFIWMTAPSVETSCGSLMSSTSSLRNVW